jgi:hypothetical protein
MWYSKNSDVSDLLTPWNRVFLEKLIIAQLVKKFPAFLETRRLPCSEGPTTGRYPEPNESIPRHSNLFL